MKKNTLKKNIQPPPVAVENSGHDFKVVYVPLILFAVAHEDVQICDYTLQGFTNEEDAIDLYPDSPIIPIQIPIK